MLAIARLGICVDLDLLRRLPVTQDAKLAIIVSKLPWMPYHAPMRRYDNLREDRSSVIVLIARRRSGVLKVKRQHCRVRRGNTVRVV